VVLHETFQLIHPPHPSSIVALVFCPLSRASPASSCVIHPRHCMPKRLGLSNKLTVQANPSWLRHVQPSKSFIPCVVGRSAELFKASRQQAIVIHHRADGAHLIQASRQRALIFKIVAPTGAQLNRALRQRALIFKIVALTGTQLNHASRQRALIFKIVAPTGTQLNQASRQQALIFKIVAPTGAQLNQASRQQVLIFKNYRTDGWPSIIIAPTGNNLQLSPR